jgi:YgiT-type zinc finger domain-containing protein
VREYPLMPDQDTGETSQPTTLCNECQTGVLHLEYLTYFTWLNQELVTVPNFPAWVCDVCGRREYDARAVTWLNTLLNPEAGRRPSSRRKPGFPRVDRPQP